MNELQEVVAAASAARDQEKPVLLATVVRVHGSAYRRPGARMLLSRDGWLAGSISGGCLESDILRKAWWRTRDGERLVVAYDSTVPSDADGDELSWGFGLGCNGIVEVLLERIIPHAPDCPVAFVAKQLHTRRKGIMATVIAITPDATKSSQRQIQAETVAIGQRLLWSEGETAPRACTIGDRAIGARVHGEVKRLMASGDGSQSFTCDIAGIGSADLFLETISPPGTLLICGAGHDATPLAQIAKTLGWQVTVVDPRTGMPPRPERFPGADAVTACAPSHLRAHCDLSERTCAVVMSHNVITDAAVLAELIASPVGYIGVLGPRQRTERLLQHSGYGSLDAAAFQDRLHAPVGLDIGADNPASIALSILAEIQAFLAQRHGGFLRDRKQPIHLSADRHPRLSAANPLTSYRFREAPACALTTVVSP